MLGWSALAHIDPQRPHQIVGATGATLYAKALTTAPSGGAVLVVMVDNQTELDWFGADIF